MAMSTSPLTSDAFESLLSHAVLLFHALAWTQSIRQHRAILRRCPSPFADESRLYFNIGIIRCHLAEYGLAAEQFKKATDRDPDFAIAWFCSGMARLQLEEYRQAARDYRACLGCFENVEGTMDNINYEREGLKWALERTQVIWNIRVSLLWKEFKKGRTQNPPTWCLVRLPAGLLFETATEGDERLEPIEGAPTIVKEPRKGKTVQFTEVPPATISPDSPGPSGHRESPVHSLAEMGTPEDPFFHGTEKYSPRISSFLLRSRTSSQNRERRDPAEATTMAKDVPDKQNKTPSRRSSFSRRLSLSSDPSSGPRSGRGGLLRNLLKRRQKTDVGLSPDQQVTLPVSPTKRRDLALSGTTPPPLSSPHPHPTALNTDPYLLPRLFSPPSSPILAPDERGPPVPPKSPRRSQGLSPAAPIAVAAVRRSVSPSRTTSSETSSLDRPITPFPGADYFSDFPPISPLRYPSRNEQQRDSQSARPKTPPPEQQTDQEYTAPLPSPQHSRKSRPEALTADFRLPSMAALQAMFSQQQSSEQSHEQSSHNVARQAESTLQTALNDETLPPNVYIPHHRRESPAPQEEILLPNVYVPTRRRQSPALEDEILLPNVYAPPRRRQAPVPTKNTNPAVLQPWLYSPPPFRPRTPSPGYSASSSMSSFRPWIRPPSPPPGTIIKKWTPDAEDEDPPRARYGGMTTGSLRTISNKSSFESVRSPSMIMRAREFTARMMADGGAENRPSVRERRDRRLGRAGWQGLDVGRRDGGEENKELQGMNDDNGEEERGRRK